MTGPGLLRVGFDARMWGRTGVGRYVRNLLAHLAPSEALALTVWTNASSAAEARALLGPRHTVHVAPVSALAPAEALYWPAALWRERASLDLFHAPHFNGPWLSPVPLVATLHDCIPLQAPESVESAAKRRYFAALAARMLASAALTLFDSETARRDASACFGPRLVPARTRVVPLAAEASFFAPVPERAIAEARAAIGLGPGAPYVLYAGQAKPHKNVGTLIAAIAALRERRPEARLVLVGEGWPHEAPGEGVLAPGALDDPTYRALLAGASAFAFPSRLEGFGLPPLEAMASGCPVVAARASCLPEVLGDGPRWAEPDGVLEWAEALERLLGDPDERRARRQAGLAQARLYGWERTAELTLQAYRAALPPRGSRT